MLAMVVIVFILCWSPILIFEALQAFDVIHWWITGSLKHAKTCFSLLAYFNRCDPMSLLPSSCCYYCYFYYPYPSCINPFIYGFMSRNFRHSFSEALCQVSPATHRSRLVLPQCHLKTREGRSHLGLDRESR